MHDPLLKLFPPPHDKVALQGLYLGQELHTLARTRSRLVYSNFISSLDGRIGLPATGKSSHQVPPAIGNPRDWRLYQELAAQADVLITTARYFRQSARDEAQDHLPVGPEKAFDDLRAWRVAAGLAPQPAVAVVSATLDLPPQALLVYRERGVCLVTGEQADPARVAALRRQDIDVVHAGAGKHVDGAVLVQALAARGYYAQYSIGGPKLLHTLLAADVLDRLYLTIAHRILGGKEFDTFALGSELIPPASFTPLHIYHDAYAPADCGQWLCAFDRATHRGQQES